jgi:hypothetical protein
LRKPYAVLSPYGWTNCSSLTSGLRSEPAWMNAEIVAVTLVGRPKRDLARRAADADLARSGAEGKRTGIAVVVMRAVHGHAGADLVHTHRLAAGDPGRFRSGNAAHRLDRQQTPAGRLRSTRVPAASDQVSDDLRRDDPADVVDDSFRVAEEQARGLGKGGIAFHRQRQAELRIGPVLSRRYWLVQQKDDSETMTVRGAMRLCGSGWRGGERRHGHWLRPTESSSPPRGAAIWFFIARRVLLPGQVLFESNSPGSKTQ